MDFTLAFNRSDFYQRDHDLGLDTNQQYISNLKKLGYLEFEMEPKINQFIKYELKQFINRELDNINLEDPMVLNKTIESFVSNIKISSKFNSYLNYLNKAKSRANILAHCGYEQFYNLCTDEELVNLGW